MQISFRISKKKALNFKSQDSDKIVQKKIPITIDIKRLKVLVSKLLKCSTMELESVRLYYSSKKVNLNLNFF
jgi:hypothetical protein